MTEETIEALPDDPDDPIATDRDDLVEQTDNAPDDQDGDQEEVSQETTEEEEVEDNDGEPAT